MRTMTTRLPAIFRQLRQSATFLNVSGYTNNYGEKSNFQLLFNYDYTEAVVRAMKIWRDIVPSDEIERQALDELLRSYEDSMWGHNPRATSAHVYDKIEDGAHQIIKGVKYFEGRGEVHLNGLLLGKQVIKQGNNPRKKLRPVPKKKNFFKSKTAIGKIRQYILRADRFESISVENLTLTHRDLLAEIGL